MTDPVPLLPNPDGTPVPTYSLLGWRNGETREVLPPEGAHVIDAPHEDEKPENDRPWWRFW